MPSVALDRIDLAIIAALQKNARLSIKELAAKVNLAPSSCLARVRKLTETKVLEGFHAEVNPGALGASLQAIIAVRLIFKSSRPTYAIILLALSVLFMCATFLPLLYSVLLPNEDIERVVGALKEGGTAPSDAETVVEQAKAAAGALTTAIQVGYYTGVTATVHLSGSHSPEQTKVSQTTYIAWFQKRPRPMLVAITL